MEPLSGANVLYMSHYPRTFHIRPQTSENWVSRPLCHTVFFDNDRKISSRICERPANTLLL